MKHATKLALALIIIAAACSSEKAAESSPPATGQDTEATPPAGEADSTGGAPVEEDAGESGEDTGESGEDTGESGEDTGLPATPPPAPEMHHVPFGPPDTTFKTGPYLLHTTGTSVEVAWETEAESDTRVEYGRDSSYGLEAAGETGLMHLAKLSNLEPGALYHYRACSGETCSGDLVLSTAPLPRQPFRFAVYGDSRSDPPMHKSVVDSVILSAPSLLLHTGDIVAHGGNRDEYRDMHFEPMRQLTHHVPAYVSIGNHEWKEVDTGVQNFRDYLVYPKDARLHRPGLSYTFRYGDAFFVALDNTLDGLDIFFPMTASYEPPVWKWLQEEVASEAAKTARWRFAFFHYPPASPCHEDWPMVIGTREHVLPLLREHGFHAVFTGHVHDYERHDFDGLKVFVTGGGGAGLEDEAGCTREIESLEVIHSVHHHVTVDLGEESALVQAVDMDGKVFDAVTIAAE
jgi:acid phosphatase type 7